MRKEWRNTHNPHLKVRWDQDALKSPGFGTLRTRSPLTKDYALAGVPRRLYRDMLRRSDPEVLLNQILTCYLPADSGPRR